MNENIVYSNIQTKDCSPTTGYKAQINGVDSDLPATLCCMLPGSPPTCGILNGPEFSRYITVDNFICENGIVKCNWIVGCSSSETQLLFKSGTATLQFSNGGSIPTGLTNVVETSSINNSECPVDDPSLCSSNILSQVTFVSI